MDPNRPREFIVNISTLQALQAFLLIPDSHRLWSTNNVSPIMLDLFCINVYQVELEATVQVLWSPISVLNCSHNGLWWNHFNMDGRLQGPAITLYHEVEQHFDIQSHFY